MKRLLCLLSFCLVNMSSIAQNGTEDQIKNTVAFEKYKEGQNAHNQGKRGWEKARVLLNEADSLEPNNPSILSERGLFRLHSQTDIDGGLLDLQRAFELTTSSRRKEIFANNLGLTYMEIADIESACETWKYAGQMGNNYIREYCTYKKEPIIQPNLDEKLTITLNLEDTIALVTSRYNIPQMSTCNALLTLNNEGYRQIRVPGGSFNYGLLQDNMDLFMEAVDQAGKKLVFFTEMEYFYYRSNEDKIVSAGESFTQEVNLTFAHHFWKEGEYKIRIGLRSGTENLGFKGVYFSNWVNLTVEFE
jgi:tetratricopeptide (TPR) repeat protein